MIEVIVIILIGVLFVFAVVIWLKPTEAFRPLKTMFDDDDFPLMENPPPPPAIKWENMRLNEDYERERLQIAAKIMAAIMANHMISGKTLQYRAKSALESADALIEEWKNNPLPTQERPTREPEPPSNLVPVKWTANENFRGSKTFVKQDEPSISTRP